MEGKLAMAGISRAYKRRGNMIANTGGPALCLDAGSRISYPGTGTTWTDLSGNGNTGTLINGPTYNSANGGSIVFDGVDDYVTVPANSALVFGTGPFTLLHGLFVAQQADVQQFAGLVSKYLTNDWFTELRPGSPYTYGFYNGAAHIDSGVTITYGQWVEIGIARAGTGTNQTGFYINGINVLNFTTSYNFTDNGKMFIGNINAESFPSFYRFKGRISSVSIYNRALSAAEISTNFNLLRGRYGI